MKGGGLLEGPSALWFAQCPESGPVPNVGRQPPTMRLAMLAGAETDAATMVAPATETANHWCRNQYRPGTVIRSQ